MNGAIGADGFGCFAETGLDALQRWLVFVVLSGDDGLGAFVRSVICP